MNNQVTHFIEWFRGRPVRIGLTILGVIAVAALVIFSSQIGELLNLTGSRANTGRLITINANPGAGEYNFIGGDWTAEPDKDTCFDTSSGRLMLNVACPQPQIVSIAPVSGPANVDVTITGSGFGDTPQARSKVEFGTTQVVSFVSWSDTQIVVKAPVAELGNYPVKVTVPGNPFAVYSAGYTYTEAPTVAMIDPNIYGIDEPNVTVTGTNFDDNATVAFGGTNATVLSRSGSTQIIVAAPVGLTGTVHVIVTNPNTGQSSLPGDNDRYTYPE